MSQFFARPLPACKWQADNWHMKFCAKIENKNSENHEVVLISWVVGTMCSRSQESYSLVIICRLAQISEQAWRPSVMFNRPYIMVLAIHTIHLSKSIVIVILKSWLFLVVQGLEFWLTTRQLLIDLKNHFKPLLNKISTVHEKMSSTFNVMITCPFPLVAYLVFCF